MVNEDSGVGLDSACSVKKCDEKSNMVKAIINRMCIAYGLEGRDIRGQLADKLGVRSAGTVKSWVYNCRVPYDAMLICKADVGCSLDWLLTGEPPLREYGFAIGEKMVSSIKEHLHNSTRYQLLSSESGITAVAENIISDIESNLNMKFVKN
ncbi:helix-turn-helix domain-containing protein [Pseudoalteromonas marina]|uniref:Helix-turn-helix domain-containing protein n=1 Tax=Pseudoalteromonas marina TaxID=267375 RepID=A0ABT9FGL3_9GAMM|nr:helix-turn-helix domain-containing protein [Pseudoalteromonas marina]MDP2565760.1 helix-turn-helix domain-containing protein [Pseudoalteromonas marina]